MLIIFNFPPNVGPESYFREEIGNKKNPGWFFKKIYPSIIKINAKCDLESLR